LDFLAALPAEVINQNIEFNTPSEVVKKLQPVSAVHVPNPISWADEERDLSAWLGNELQEEAFNKLYSLLHRVEKCDDAEIIKDWEYLQVSDHFYYMCTKFFSDGEVHKYFNPYDSPYEAFINYMNVLSDFALRLDEFVPENEVKQQLSELQKTISEKNAKIKNLETENKKLLSKVKNTMSKPSTKKPKLVKKAAPKKK
jgi:alpha-amylase